VLWRLLQAGVSHDVGAAKQTLGGLLDPAKRLFGEGEFWNGPQDPQAASDMRGLLMTTGAGASALPREIGSVGAFGFGRLGGTGIANEVASLRGQLESITGKPLPPRPRPVAGTSPQQLAEYDRQHLDQLRRAVAAAKANQQTAIANTSPHSVPTPTPPPSPDVVAAKGFLDRTEKNPFVQAIPGRQGFPTKEEQRRVVQQHFGLLDLPHPMDAPGPGEGPWGAKPPDPNALTSADKEALRQAFWRDALSRALLKK